MQCIATMLRSILYFIFINNAVVKEEITLSGHRFVFICVCIQKNRREWEVTTLCTRDNIKKLCRAKVRREKLMNSDRHDCRSFFSSHVYLNYTMQAIRCFIFSRQNFTFLRCNSNRLSHNIV